MSQATQKQIDFATTISEWVGVDLPESKTKESLSEYIDEYSKEFYRIRNQWRYRSGKTFSMNHACHMSEYEYERINKNPESIKR